MVHGQHCSFADSQEIERGLAFTLCIDGISQNHSRLRLPLDSTQQVQMVWQKRKLLAAKTRMEVAFY